MRIPGLCAASPTSAMHHANLPTLFVVPSAGWTSPTSTPCGCPAPLLRKRCGGASFRHCGCQPAPGAACFRGGSRSRNPSTTAVASTANPPDRVLHCREAPSLATVAWSPSWRRCRASWTAWRRCCCSRHPSRRPRHPGRRSPAAQPAHLRWRRSEPCISRGNSRGRAARFTDASPVLLQSCLKECLKFEGTMGAIKECQKEFLKLLQRVPKLP